MSAPSDEYPFQISISGAIAEALRQLQRQASREGRGDEFLAAVRSVIEQLRQKAPDVGEPLYRLPGLHLQVRCVSVRPLYVDFAVSEDRPLVSLKAVRLLAPPRS